MDLMGIDSDGEKEKIEKRFSSRDENS